MKSIVDVEKLRVVQVDEQAEPDEQLHAEILIVGGGLGGVAAALAVGEAGRTVCLTEETAWLGGQATSQGVSAFDENGYIETSGGTRSYLAMRAAIREWYRRNTKLTGTAAKQEHLDPGNAWVSRLCFEPRVVLGVIEALLEPHTAGGHLRVLKRHKPFDVALRNRRIQHVDFVELDSGRRTRITAGMVIDASELGDLLALGAAGFVTGAESKAMTGEPGAADTADPEDVQSFTYPFVIEHRPGEKHATPKPADYTRNREEQPYTLVIQYKDGPKTYGVFRPTEKTPGSFWAYRRLIDAAQFEDPAYPHDLAMINWPGNDYRGGNVLVDDAAEQVRQLRAAKDLSLGLLYWLQHEVARDEGGRGYPEFMLRTDVLGTADGLSKFPYIRESRRIVAVKTILEPEVTTSGPRAVHFPDSVGIGFYGIDLHESKRGRKQIINATRPFQIPLGALILRETENLLAGCKNIGTTHITNGCYRLHPIEWNIGESAGATTAMCIERSMTPRTLRESKTALFALQRRLVNRGVPIMWYDDVAVSLPITAPAEHKARFERVQLLPFERPEILQNLTKDLHAPPPSS